MRRCRTCGEIMHQGYYMQGNWYCSDPCATDPEVGNQQLFNDLQEDGPSDEAYWSTVVEDEEWDEEEEFDDEEDDY